MSNSDNRPPLALASQTPPPNNSLPSPALSGIPSPMHASAMLTGPMPGVGGDGSHGGGNESALDIAALLRALKRRLVLALSLALLGASLVLGAVILLLPAKYTADAAVQVRSQGEQAVLNPLFQGSQPEFVIFKASMAAMVKNPLVLLNAVNKVKDQNLKILRNQDDPVKWLETAIKTDFLLGPEILRLKLSAGNPQEVAILLNAVAESFIEENQQREAHRRRELLRQLKANRQETENSLRQKKNTLRKLTVDRGLDDPLTLKSRYENAEKRLMKVNEKVLDHKLELAQARVELQALQQRERSLPTAQVDEHLIQTELGKLPQEKAFADRYAKITEEMSLINKTVLNPEPHIRQKRQELEALSKERSDLRKLMTPQIEELIRGMQRSKMRSEIAVLESKIDSLVKSSTILDAEVVRAEAAVTSTNPSNHRWPADVEALSDEINRLDSAVTKLGEAIALIEVDAAPASRVSIWQLATPPDGPDMKNVIRFGGAGGMGVFGLILFGVAFVEYRSRRIGAVDEVARGLGMPVVGTVPSVPLGLNVKGSAGNSTKQEHWQGQLNEAVDSIRTLLLHAARSDNLNVIMVTSAVGGEGKTSLASQLAASLARVWRRTLLVDGDLRKPALHTLFDQPLEPGFADVLREEMKPEEVIKPTALSRLWLMSAGQGDNHALQALAQENLRGLFENLKEHYDFIIVDSCPVLPVSDSLSLGQHMDGVIFSVLRDVSRAPALQSARQRLHNLGIRTLGAVVLGDNDKNCQAGYQYGTLQKI